MPRTYIKKKVPKYSKEDLDKAINEVQNNQSSMYAAAHKHGIPTTTLYDKLKENHTLNVGRPQAIPFEQEQRLADGLRTMEKWGFGLSRNETLEIVADYVEKNNLETPFANNKPGPDWFINFRKRHRLSVKKPQPVEYVRKKMTDPFIIREYFEMLENTLTELNLLERPDLIWNLDETSLCLDPTRTKVVGAVNKACSRTTFGSAKENITVLAAASGSGKKISPLIIFKGKNVWNQWMATTDNYDFELAYAASTKGWMEGPIFLNYLERVLFPALGEERPVLIVYDGHSTHVTLDVVKLAIRYGITILKLPPHTSHLLQPLDVAVFKSFKCKWDAKLVAWQRRNVGTKMPKNIFAQTFAETWQETSPEVIKNGFKKTGIHPFNPNVISEDKFEPAAFKRFKEKQSTQALKNPKPLQELCIDVVNETLQLSNNVFESEKCTQSLAESNFNTTNAILATTRNLEEADFNTNNATLATSQNLEEADFGTKNVTLIAKLSRKDDQTQPFVANDTSSLPKCLTFGQSRKPEPKVKIISNIKINFEELLLEKIKQDKKDNNCSTKKKRVAKGAEVITAAKLVEEKEKLVKESASKKSEKKSDNKNKKSTAGKKKSEYNAPGPSRTKKITKKQNKKKRKNNDTDSNDSATDISDIISLYSDIDVEQYYDYDTLGVEYCAENYEIEQPDSLKNYDNDEEAATGHEISKNTINTTVSVDKNALTKTKNKGKGKRSKGKENNEDIKIKKCNKTDDDQISRKSVLSEHNESENEYPTHQPKDTDLQRVENYNINDSVLVRYYNRKKWTYYIGFITNIIQKDEDTQYCVDYLITVKKPQLIFIKPKKIDHDVVTDLSIVKKIKLQKKGQEYSLLDDCDSTFFKT